MTHTRLQRSALAVSLALLFAPTTFAQESDLDVEVLHAVRETEVNHRSRMARITRLREIAEQQSDARRLKELEQLERAQRELYSRRIEQAKKEHGRLAVRRVTERLGITSSSRAPEVLTRSAPPPRQNAPRTDSQPPSTRPPTMVLPSEPAPATGRPLGAALANPSTSSRPEPPPNPRTSAKTTVPRVIDDGTGTRRVRPNEYVPPTREANEELRQKVMDQRAKEREKEKQRKQAERERAGKSGDPAKQKDAQERTGKPPRNQERPPQQQPKAEGRKKKDGR